MPATKRLTHMLLICVVIFLAISEPGVCRTLKAWNVVDANVSDVLLVRLQVPIFSLCEGEIRSGWMHSFCQSQVFFFEGSCGGSGELCWLSRDEYAGTAVGHLKLSEVVPVVRTVFGDF
jgi:hypothetical protein